MVNGFDRIVVAVPEPGAAEAAYRELLGRPPLAYEPGVVAAQSRCFDLGNTVVELVPGEKEHSYIREDSRQPRSGYPGLRWRSHCGTAGTC